jgi:hypothetical protein
MSIPTECCLKISEFMKRNWPGAARILFIKGNHGFYNGAKPKIFEIYFLGRKIYKYCSWVYQKMRNSNIWGGMFSEKSSLCLFFHEKIMILDFWDYNGACLPLAATIGPEGWSRVFLANPGEARGCSINSLVIHSLSQSSFSSHSFTAPPRANG